ncbi:PREDICTED: iron sulfur cluster assembly protein 1-like [Vollenhovia emeryi]|uniref:iron sulfur cluster assembly protein 1-like n=1 Tax=Vollenhovia emeryi TaxID=411798 RepID=UPI0005F40086|nr:PREDICTED: iron sulfur cluster assembly protein 1-like [Vollenhovia emeryi]
MSYNEKILDHYENPRNVGSLDKNDPNVGTGLVGAPSCGDVMKLQIKVNDKGVIEDAKFKTFGCGSAIASSSLLTEMIKGKAIEDVTQIKNTQIVEELSLPPVKIHCSVLAEDAIKASIIEENCSDDQKVKVLIDPKSVMFILGSEMDYVEEKFSSGFVFKNPNEKGKCGCGESFHV